MTPGNELAENKLVVIGPAGDVRGTYLKSHPTPGEASVAGDNRVGWTDTPFGRIAWAICYDYDYPALIAQAGRAGADILINPAWDDRGMTPLHARMATLRSIENGAAQLRPTNGGLSLAVDGRGAILSQVGPREPHSIVAFLPTKHLPSLYPRLGNWLAVVSLVMLLALTLHSLWSARRRRALLT
jgi:apolipoprotein N-acyltransferase